MSQQSTSERPQIPSPSLFSVCLQAVKVTGLSAPRGKAPSPLAILTIDDEKKWSSETLKKTIDPIWDLECPISLSVRPSSVVNIDVYRKSVLKFKKNHHLGGYRGLVGELVENESPHPLADADGSPAFGSVVLKLIIDPSPVNDQVLTLANENMKSADTALDHIDRFSDGSKPFSYFSNYVDDAATASNKVERALRFAETAGSSVEAISQAVRSISRIVDIVDGIAEVHPICKAAFTLLVFAYKALKQQTEQDDAIKALCVQLRDMLSAANECRDLRGLGTDIIAETARAVATGATLIDDYVKHSFLGRTVRSAFSSSMSNRLTACLTLYTETRARFELTLSVRTWKTVQNIQQDLESDKNREILEKLPRVDAGYDRARICLQGTRQDVVEEVVRWVANVDPNQPRVFWLYGMGGEGKSTIARTIACHLEDELDCLGATFFFSRDIAARSRPDNVFSTIAFELSSRYPALGSAVCKSFRDNQSGSSTVTNQFHILLRKPVENSQEVLGKQPIAVIFDALDECGTERERVDFLAACQELPKFPAVFKFLFVSRPERDIKIAFDNLRSSTNQYNLSEVSKSIVDRDISLFAQTGLLDLAKRYPDTCGTSDWQNLEMRQALVTRAAGLFIWVSTAVEFLGDGDVDDPESQREVLFSKSMHNSIQGSPSTILHSLYLQVLDKAYSNRTSPRRLTLFREIVGAILLLKNPLSPVALGGLLDFGRSGEPDSASNVIYEAVSKLRSVIYVPEIQHRSQHALRIIHPSFSDFLTNIHSSSERFFIEMTTHHGRLARQCLLLMQKCLRSDICRIGDFTKLNKEIQDLEERLFKYMSPELQYACKYWTEHLRDSPKEVDLYNLVRNFFFTNLIDWLEALSLLGILDSALVALESVENWIALHDDNEFSSLLSDAHRFIQEYFSLASTSATHIRISAIPFSPNNCILSKKFDKDWPSIKVSRGRRAGWMQCICILQGHSSSITCMAFSPDGTRIVSGSYTGTLHTWDSTTGASLSVIQTGDRKEIHNVIFNYDGTRILSKSEDGTIRFWDPLTGLSVGKDLVWHLPPTRSITLSPSGKQILSLSIANATVLQIWDAFSGTVVRELPTNHTDRISQATWFRDGTKIVTGSCDCTLRIWDLTTGHSVADPLTGHTFSITIIEFSSDGSKFASASRDHTIRIWDTATGQGLVGPLAGHTSQITSLSWNSRDTRVLSRCYGDHTLRIWDSVTGASIGQPIENYTNDGLVTFSPDGLKLLSGPYRTPQTILNIWDISTGISNCKINAHHSWASAFSPDGTQIATGSHDGMIQTWNSSTGLPIGQPLIGHTTSILALVWSANGKRILSSSNDRTLRVWDATTFDLCDERPLDHSSTIVDVSFSPDGQRVVSASADGILRVWDWVANKLVGEMVGGERMRDDLNPLYLSWSLDGLRILVWFQDRNPRLFDPWTYSLIAEFDRSYNGWVRFSDDSTRVVWFSDNTLRIFNSTTGENVGEPLHACTPRLEAVRFSPGGKYMFSFSPSGTYRLWDIETCTFCGTFVGPDGMHDFGLSERWSDSHADECRITFEVEEYLPKNGSHVEKLLSPSVSSALVAFSPNEDYLVCCYGDFTLRIWDMMGTAIGQPLVGHTALITYLMFTSDGAHIISGSNDGTIKMWDFIIGNQILELFTGRGSIMQFPESFNESTSTLSMALSPDKKYLASASLFDPCILRIWESDTGKWARKQFSGHSRPITQVIWIPSSSRIVTGSNDSTLRIWDVATASPVGPPLVGHDKPVTSMVILPNGKSVVSGSHDCTLRIWDTTTGLSIGKPLRGHAAGISCVDFSHSGQRIVSGSYDGTIRFWDSATGNPIGDTLKCHSSPINSIAFSLDNLTMATCDELGKVNLWDLNTESEVSERWQSRYGETSAQNLYTWKENSKHDLPMLLCRDGWVLGPGDQRLWWMPVENMDSGGRYQNTYSTRDGLLVVGSGSGILTFVDGSSVLRNIYPHWHGY